MRALNHAIVQMIILGTLDETIDGLGDVTVRTRCCAVQASHERHALRTLRTSRPTSRRRASTRPSQPLR